MEDKKMAVTAAMVKELREMTGAGMMDCKKALSNTDGDMDKAVEYLRENGMAKAAKKAGRIAAEGIVKVVTEGSKAAIVEVNSETDFVAKNADFNAYVEEVAQQALNTKASDIDGFLAESWNKDSSKTVADVLAGQIAVIGENLKIRRFAQIEENNGFIASYIHMGGKIGVLVDVETDVVNPAIEEMAKNVAMQAAALKPMYTNRSEVDPEYIAKETEIITITAKNEKPDANDKIIEGMVKGRLNKELKEICLLDQTYVKAEDGKQSVSAYVASVAKENSANITIKGFVRFETGEGLEKKNEDFAAEVAAQLQ
jgi:elongation factor Ts